MNLLNSNMILFAFCLSIFFSACSDDGGSGLDPSGQEDTIVFNAKIYTVNDQQPWVEAMYIKDGMIEAIGTSEDIQAMASDETVITDAGGKFIMPGIHDVHMHPLEASSNNFLFVMSETSASIGDYAADIEFALSENPNVEWLLGWGHALEVLLESNRSPIDVLDEISSTVPIAIMEQTSHSFWCNSAALNAAGITIDSENPTGGIYMRDENDKLNGILIDNAGNYLLDIALQPTAEREVKDYDGLLNYGLVELAKHGITSVCDARTYWKRNHHKVWQRLADENNLTVRANLGLWVYPHEDDAGQLATIKSLYQNNQSSLLKINQIKLYSDGIIHNTTAAMHTDYLIDYFEESTNNGVNYITESRIGKYIKELEPIGFDFHIHALGNRGIHESLNAIEANGTSAGRHRLTHVEFLDPVDYSRFAQLNVTADAQVAGDFTCPDHWHDNDYLIGAALSDNIIPLKSLSDAGARITLSSDWDVSTLNPFVGMQHAVTRSPQNISLEEAVKAYTINAAYVMRQENIVGSLVPGKEADYIILNQNPFEINTNQIGNTEVLETYLQGERIYKK